MTQRKLHRSCIYDVEGDDFIKGRPSDVSTVVDKMVEMEFYRQKTYFIMIESRLVLRLVDVKRTNSRSKRNGSDSRAIIENAKEEALMQWVANHVEAGLALESLLNLAPETLHGDISILFDQLFGDKKRKLEHENGPEKKQKIESKE